MQELTDIVTAFKVLTNCTSPQVFQLNAFSLQTIIADQYCFPASQGQNAPALTHVVHDVDDEAGNPS
jgi:hypothetical protein